VIAGSLGKGSLAIFSLWRCLMGGVVIKILNNILTTLSLKHKRNPPPPNTRHFQHTRTERERERERERDCVDVQERHHPKREFQGRWPTGRLSACHPTPPSFPKPVLPLSPRSSTIFCSALDFFSILLSEKDNAHAFAALHAAMCRRVFLFLRVRVCRSEIGASSTFLALSP
jgi:hypothetical protein